MGSVKGSKDAGFGVNPDSLGMGGHEKSEFPMDLGSVPLILCH